MEQNYLLGLMALRDGFGNLSAMGGGNAGPQTALPMAMQYKAQQAEQQKWEQALQQVQQDNPNMPAGFSGPAFQAWAKADPQAALANMAKQQTQAPAPDPTSIREYRFARQQGYGGSYQNWVTNRARAGGANITNTFSPNGGGPFKYGKIDPGYRVNTQTGVAELVPGSAAAREIDAQNTKSSAQQQTKARTADLMIEDIGRARGLGSKAFTTGFVGDWASVVKGTDAFDLQELLVGIEANIGFDRLQRMRDESPTGGALGQVSDSERRALNATLGSLRQAQSQEQFLFNLNRLQRQYGETVHGEKYREVLFGDLVRSGMDRQSAYQRLMEIGY